MVAHESGPPSSRRRSQRHVNLVLVSSDGAPPSFRAAAQPVCPLFRDARQASLAIRALLHPVNLHELWTDFGPTPRARQIFQEYGATLTATEWTLLHAAFDLWDGVSDVELSRLDALDIEHARSLCTLIMAVKTGPDAVDHWLSVALPACELSDHERPSRGPRPGLRQAG